MRVIPPLAITDTVLTGSVVNETALPAYNGATTYAVNDTVSVAGAAGLITHYISNYDGNLGNTPASSPVWWTQIDTIYQAYSGATTYAVGDRVQDNVNHVIYESLQASNLNHTPASSPTWWETVGPTNKWAMFDLLRNTATACASPLTVTLAPDVRINSLALLGMVADAVEITLTSGGSTVYHTTANLSTRDVHDWYSYFFEPFSTAADLALFDIPPYTNGIVTVTLTRTSGNVACGALAIGSNEYLGEAQYNAKSDIINFSSVERDVFGNASMTQRRNIPKTLQTCWLDKPRVNRVASLRDTLNATPAVWSWLDDATDDYFGIGFVLGFYRTFAIDASGPRHAIVNLELEEI